MWVFVVETEPLSLQANYYFGAVERVRRRVVGMMLYPDVDIYIDNAADGLDEDFLEYLRELRN